MIDSSSSAATTVTFDTESAAAAAQAGHQSQHRLAVGLLGIFLALGYQWRIKGNWDWLTQISLTQLNWSA